MGTQYDTEGTESSEQRSALTRFASGSLLVGNVLALVVALGYWGIGGSMAGGIVGLLVALVIVVAILALSRVLVRDLL
jgi:type IV secretory pathway VirB6-like protein